jgi:anti-anti-sigma factor
MRKGAVLVPTLDDVQVDQSTSGTAVVVFSGEHDLATKGAVGELLDSLVEVDDLVVADFSSASFVDASILGVLLLTNDRAVERGKVFRLQLGTAVIVRRAFEICGIFEVIEHVVTREEAIAQGER